MEQLRRATLADLEAICELRESQSHYPARRDFVAACLRDGIAVLAKDDQGELVGFAYGIGFAPEIVQLANLLVAGHMRHQGLGRRLVEDFEAAARLGGFQAIILSNAEAYAEESGMSDIARRLYLRLGYQQVVETPSGTAIFIHSL